MVLAAPNPGGPRLTVLSVEDDMLVAMGTNGTLEDLGHDVVEAHSGAQALTLLAERPDIDLLITDQGMPGMTGVALAEAARALRPNLPVILVTGYLQKPDDRGLNMPWLQKPFRAAELAEAIRAALDAGASQPDGGRGSIAEL
jgi:CheY-like chemotaxis protein